MGKTEVIVDTCFLQKVSSEGKEIDNTLRTYVKSVAGNNISLSIDVNMQIISKKTKK